MIKVIVIDDSALVRKVISGILNETDDIEVVATANDPLAAIKKIKRYKPDVLTLDLQMPRMDGLTFLRKLMIIFPMPVIVISSLSKKGSKEALKSMELGAFDVVAKPTLGIKNGLNELSQDIVKKIRSSVNANISSIEKQLKKDKIDKDKNKKILKFSGDSTIEMIAIGASTGGTVAVRKILRKLPAGLPGIIIVLHMPGMFTSSFAESLNRECRFTVKEAEKGEHFKRNTAYIAPGNYHMIVQRGVSDYYLKLDNGPKINHLRPNINKTFNSIANIVAP
ncbi:MAG: chemotaxis-specific protein-glutamate methyltransferase CheB, partial [Bacillota bacterium]